MVIGFGQNAPVLPLLSEVICHLVIPWQSVHYLARPTEVLNCSKFPPLISELVACTDESENVQINFLLQ